MINIITRRGGPESGRSLEVAGGRFGYVRTRQRAHGMLGVMDYTLSGSYLDNGTPIEDSTFTSRAFNANAGLSLSDTIDLRWVLRYADSRSTAFPDDSGGPKFAVRRALEHRDTRELTLGLTLTQALRPWWEYSVQMDLYDRQADLDSPEWRLACATRSACRPR